VTHRTILITGASDGIGAASAATLAERGERVLVVGRSPEKTAAVAARIGAEPFVADFADLEQVRDLADRVRNRIDGHLDVLANNAGGVFGARTMTTDGHELTFQVNHLAPFLLTHLLLDELRAAGGSVVASSSSAARVFGHVDMDDLENGRRYRPQRAYGTAKLENILFTRGLHARFHDQGISSMAFHPGVVATNFAAETNPAMRWVYHGPLTRLFTIPATEGASHLTWAIDGRPGIDWESGRFYDQRRPTSKVNPQVHDDRLVDALWERSAAMVGLL
jgi:NAD(P)-dependent dehydrogenase (short-subunit alcohol dehydrogenase family)